MTPTAFPFNSGLYTGANSLNKFNNCCLEIFMSPNPVSSTFLINSVVVLISSISSNKSSATSFPL